MSIVQLQPSLGIDNAATGQFDPAAHLDFRRKIETTSWPSCEP
jgi:hypothetical protein